MTFGEHLEALRSHLWKAILGLAIAMTLCLWKGDIIVAVVRRPLEASMRKYNHVAPVDDLKNMKSPLATFWETISMEPDTTPGGVPAAGTTEAVAPSDSLTVEVPAGELHSAVARTIGKEVEPLPADSNMKPVLLTIKNPLIEELRGLLVQSQKPVTLNVQEGFMTYLKLSGVAGLLLASPWIFYQVWMFVAAGLYSHERKYVYIYGGLSLVLFLVGVVFCYYLVFPFVLRFLIMFNTEMGFNLQPRLSEWITFAIVLPLMFGVSFQLPLVMVFLERLQILNTAAYRENWKFAVLAISFLSMILTPADPISMLMMMFPLVGLYFFGILLCKYSPTSSAVAKA